MQKSIHIMVLAAALATALACTRKQEPAKTAADAPPAAAHTAGTAAGTVPEAARLEIVPGILNRDLYIEMKARHDIITARILNDQSVKSKMEPLKKAYNALCADYKVTLSDFNQYDSDIIDWGSNYPEAFAELKERIENRRQEILKTMPQ